MITAAPRSAANSRYCDSSRNSAILAAQNTAETVIVTAAVTTNNTMIATTARPSLSPEVRMFDSPRRNSFNAEYVTEETT